MRPVKKEKTRDSTSRFLEMNRLWTAGRGPRPRWLREALASGQSLEQFARGPAAAKKATPGRAGKGRKRARSAKFRDAAGHTWGGMGKRPQWLRDALASGKRLEDFLIASGNGGSAGAG